MRRPFFDSLQEAQRSVKKVACVRISIVRRLALLLVVAGSLTASMTALAHTPARGPLTGTWRGIIAGAPGSGVKPQRIVIVVNGPETGGTWSLGSTCRGPLTLDSISDGFHHYLRHVASGSTCSGGDIDCLERAGVNVYDAVTSHLGGAWDVSGTLRRVR
jgi:hypothetical protein